MKSFDEYNAREQQLVQFNKWADHEGLSLRMSGEFDHSNKDTHMAYLGYVEGQQSKQAEVDELQKRIDDIVKWVERNKASIPLSEWHGYTTEEYVDADDLLDILKGDQS